MDDIAAWLEGIGLGQCAELFRANDLTAAVLPELTDQDLRGSGCRSATADCCSKRSTTARSHQMKRRRSRRR
jgi:phage gp46-like protein